MARPRQARVGSRKAPLLESRLERGGRSSIRQSTRLWSWGLGVQIPSVTLPHRGPSALARLRRASSSIWQSNGLLIRRFRVRVPGGPREIRRSGAALTACDHPGDLLIRHTVEVPAVGDAREMSKLYIGLERLREPGCDLRSSQTSRFSAPTSGWMKDPCVVLEPVCHEGRDLHPAFLPGSQARDSPIGSPRIGQQLDLGWQPAWNRIRLARMRIARSPHPRLRRSSHLVSVQFDTSGS
jgi:hypothetical protein